MAYGDSSNSVIVVLSSPIKPYVFLCALTIKGGIADSGCRLMFVAAGAGHSEECSISALLRGVPW
jgi:hypothetical protein